MFWKNRKAGALTFRCRCCGGIHEGSPSFAYAKPPAFFDVPEDERSRRVVLDSDTCAVDGQAFYIRATLDVPILGRTEPFNWGVWVSQSEQSFRRYRETFDGDQSGLGSFGWLAVTMPPYRTAGHEPIVALGCDVVWGPPGKRPRIEVQPADHPLYHDQRDGISVARSVEMVETLMHPGQR